MHPPSHLQGNALFIILIAVALFAALSYAVTKSGRDGASTDKETLTLDAARMVQEFSAIATAVQRMVLTGTNPADLDFSSSGSGPDAVFAPEGGGALWPTSPLAVGYAVNTNGTIDGVGTTTGRDFAIIANGVSLEFCQEVNKKFTGSTNAPSCTFGCAIFMTNPGVGGFVGTSTCGTCGGEVYYCVRTSSPTTYHYYHLLLAQ